VPLPTFDNDNVVQSEQSLTRLQFGWAHI